MILMILLPLACALTIVLPFDLLSSASINSLISTVNSQLSLWRLDRLTNFPAATQVGLWFRCATSTVLPLMIAARATSRPSKGFDVGQLDVKSSSKLRNTRSSGNGFTSWFVGEDNFRFSSFVCLPWKNLRPLQLFSIPY